MISLRDVVVRYPGSPRPALDGVTLEVRSGETLALVGPSGSGKTTLLRAINGLVPIDGGSILVDGIPVEKTRGAALRRVRTRLAMIAQHHDLVDRLAVHQNVTAGALGRWSTAHALRYLMWPRESELDDARAALERVSIADKLHARTSALSGGERQRVAIARALMQEPHALLADEPIASLDPHLGAQIIALLCRLTRESGIALICSLHQVQFAQDFFDRIVVVEHGKLCEVETKQPVA